MSDWGDVYMLGLLFQWASTLKIQLSCWSNTKVTSSSHWKLTCSRHDFSWKIAVLAINNNNSFTLHHELLDPCRMSLSKLNMDMVSIKYWWSLLWISGHIYNFSVHTEYRHVFNEISPGCDWLLLLGLHNRCSRDTIMVFNTIFNNISSMHGGQFY